MAKKIRGKGEGTIHQRSNGTWRAQITLQARRLSKTTKTQREAQKWLRDIKNKIDNGLTYDSTQITLKQFLDSWMISNKSSFRSSTLGQYKTWIGRYINPILGNFKVNEIRPDQIQMFYNNLLAEGKSDWIVRKVHAVLHSALNHAFKIGMIGRNPASQTIRPRKPNKEMNFLEESQISLLLAIAKNTQWEPLLHVAISTGMRQSELLGLRWDDLDWVNNTIRVERQLRRTNDKSILYAPLKTRYSRRTIELGNKTIQILRSHYRDQHKKRKAAGDRWEENGLIFTTRHGGKINHRNLLRDYKNLLRKAGLPEISFHDLRHTASGLMLTHGVPVIVASRRLGHSKPSVTLDLYGHLIPSIKSEVGEKMDQLISPIEVSSSAPNCTRSAPDFASEPITVEQDPHIQVATRENPP